MMEKGVLIPTHCSAGLTHLAVPDAALQGVGIVCNE